MGIGRVVGNTFASARDALARLLVAMGVTPNTLTITGAVLTLLAGVCYALGAASDFAWSFNPADDANALMLLGTVLLIFSCACDMLDGAVARIGGKGSDFGAFLDSTIDRFSDFAVFAGIAIAYIAKDPSNITFSLLAILSFFNAFMVSYSKARAEDLIDSCAVGFWRRGERLAAVLFASTMYNIPALLLQQGILTMGTAYRRISHTRAVLQNKPVTRDVRNAGWWLKIRIWRHPRMTFGYDLTVLLHLIWLAFADLPARDVLREWFM